MNFLSLMSGCGGIDLGLERAGFKCQGQVEIMPYALKVLSKHWKEIPKHTDILTLLRSASLARIYQTPTQKEGVLKAKEVLCSLSVYGLSTSLTRLGYSLRMFPDSFRLTKEGTLRLSCKRFPKAGMGIRGEFWTVNTSESPNDAKECLLSDVLEENVHPKYYLSKKAVAGMIRRSKKWGRGGYVFLLNAEKGKTRRLTFLSLQQLEQALIQTQTTERVLSQKQLQHTQQKICLPQKEQKEISLFKPSEGKTARKSEIKAQSNIISSPKHLEQAKEETLEGYGRTLILRKLTPIEKEKLQGFPRDWTLIEE